MGFTGTVVSDYVGVRWAQTRQRVAATAEEMGSLALAAGMDVELPNIQAYGKVLINAVTERDRARVAPGRIRSPRAAR
jgi:beta-xylosidase